MVEIKVTGNTPLEALSSLTAFGLHCLSNNDVAQAANRIMEAEKHQEQKLAAAQALIAGMQAARAGELDVAPLQEL